MDINGLTQNKMNKTLVEIFSKIGNFSGNDYGSNDKNSLHTYLETYDKLLAPFQKGCSFLEIGLASGDSIKLFNEYFSNSHITGIDISLVFSGIEEKNGNHIRLIEADATRYIPKIDNDKYDIIIDDGSHLTDDQIATFELLKGKMNKGGVYIIEDILALDIERKRFEALHNNIEIVDMRHTGRFDNILLIYRF